MSKFVITQKTGDTYYIRARATTEQEASAKVVELTKQAGVFEFGYALTSVFFANTDKLNLKVVEGTE